MLIAGAAALLFVGGGDGGGGVVELLVVVVQGYTKGRSISGVVVPKNSKHQPAYVLL